MSSSLIDLPPELLSHILSYAENARTLLCLALTCKKLGNYIHNEGYRVFVQSQFPTVPIPSSWKDAAHALTTRCRAWNRKSLTARYLCPPQDRNTSRPTNHGRRAQGQTIGYQPVIDSYESWTGPDWSSRREVVAWGAGAELIVRIKWMGPETKEVQRLNALKGIPPMERDQHYHQSRWWNIKRSSHQDGKDDITAVKLLHEAQRPSKSGEYIVVGRANGELEVIFVDHNMGHRWKRLTTFATEGRPVRFISINSAVPPLLAVCLDDGTVSIYSTAAQDILVKPVGVIRVRPKNQSCRIWSLTFLRFDRLAIGLGPSTEPIRVFEIKSDSITSEPIATFSICGMSRKGVLAPVAKTIYPIAPLPHAHCGCQDEGDLFLSGGYDGTVRLHDLRFPAPGYLTPSFSDPVDSSSAIYSLLPLDRDRFLAGSANHSLLKVFDMRSAVEKLCFCGSATASVTSQPRLLQRQPEREKSLSSCGRSESLEKKHRNWNVFLVDRSTHRAPKSNVARSLASSVYSLSTPSIYSPRIFAGVEGNVIQVDATSVYDRFPDPIFPAGYVRSEQKLENWVQLGEQVRRWDPRRETMCLALYEHGRGAVHLKQQVSIGELGGMIPGWDERWKDKQQTKSGIEL
ncbi:MAG: hypothetical protein Q9222_004614 [Ikaeria aurantiellina]